MSSKTDLSPHEGDYYITSYKGKILSALCQNGKLVQAAFSIKNTSGHPVGTIVIGKVLNIMDNIQAAFVELSPGKRGFLPYANMTSQTRPKQGDCIPVQVLKDAVKTKDPVLTMELSISGKYAVISSTDTRFHISKKASPKQAARLKNLIGDSLSDYPYGIILRTNALPLQDAAPILQELSILKEKMDHILSFSASRTVYSIMLSPMPDYVQKLRDTYALDFSRLITDEEQIFHELQDYLSVNDPNTLKKLSLFQQKSMSLLNFYKLGEMIDSALSKKVWLKCGGYLVIEPTESLVAVDVNTGKYVGKSDSESSFYRVNLEAAKEIARQLRIRNLSGMILIDFINMREESHKQELMNVLRSYVAEDPVLTTVIDMTPLGLVEITRKKINKSLKEQYYETDAIE